MDNISFETTRQRPEASESDPSREMVVPKKYVFTGFTLALLAVLTYSGLLSRGYESKTISFSGISKTTQGTSLGTKRLFLRQGQTFTVDYAAEIERGSLSIRLHKRLDLQRAPAVGQVRLSDSGSGQLQVQIPETGFYSLWINGWPDRSGYHLSYTASWKAR